MKKFIIMLLIMFISLPVFAADNAVVKQIKGRVEIQNPGGSWMTASAGDSIAKGASISTGFGASAVLEFGASVLTVEALTRMKLEELIKDQGTQTTGLYLRVGKVNAEVKRDSNLSHNFRLRSPSSTAAVRGTKFSFDGNNLIVHEGAVSLISAALTREVLVAANESSKVSSTGASDPSSEKKKESSTSGSSEKTETTAGGGESQPGSGTGGGSDVDLYGSIVITVD